MTFLTISMIYVSQNQPWFCPCTQFKINKILASFKHVKTNRCVLYLKDRGNPYLQFEEYLYLQTSLAVKGSQRILIWIASKSKFKMHNLSRIFIQFTCLFKGYKAGSCSYTCGCESNQVFHMKQYFNSIVSRGFIGACITKFGVHMGVL